MKAWSLIVRRLTNSIFQIPKHVCFNDLSFNSLLLSDSCTSVYQSKCVRLVVYLSVYGAHIFLFIFCSQGLYWVMGKLVFMAVNWMHPLTLFLSHLSLNFKNVFHSFSSPPVLDQWIHSQSGNRRLSLRDWDLRQRWVWPSSITSSFISFTSFTCSVDIGTCCCYYYYYSYYCN